MKNLFKLFGIIALVAVIGFSFAACGGNGNGNGGGNGGGGGGSWPPSNVREKYGIGGLNQPPGSNVKTWTETKPAGYESIVIYFTPTSTTASYLDNWFKSNGFEGGTIQTTVWQKEEQWGGYQAAYLYNADSDLATLTVMKLIAE